MVRPVAPLTSKRVARTSRAAARCRLSAAPRIALLQPASRLRARPSPRSTPATPTSSGRKLRLSPRRSMRTRQQWPCPPATTQPTFTATVTSNSPGSGTPTGSVTFTVTDSSNASQTCTSGDTVTLVNGSASCTIVDGSLQPASSYTVVVSYSGDANFSPSSGNFP